MSRVSSGLVVVAMSRNFLEDLIFCLQWSPIGVTYCPQGDVMLELLRAIAECSTAFLNRARTLHGPGSSSRPNRMIFECEASGSCYLRTRIFLEGWSAIS